MTVMAKWGRIDILVCNAATNPVFGPMASASDEAFDKIMLTNVKSVFWLANMVLPRMAEQGRRGDDHHLEHRRAARQQPARSLRNLQGRGSGDVPGARLRVGPEEHPRQLPSHRD